VCTVKKISPSEIKFFIPIITVMVYVFNLFHVVELCIMETVVCTSRAFNIKSGFECVIVLAISF
jgi:hypothetical protein